MNELKIVFDLDGARAIHHDEHNDLFKELGFQPPRRASHVEPISSGPSAWNWYVDLSPLGEEWQFCLWPPKPSREAAMKAEVVYLEANWMKTNIDISPRCFQCGEPARNNHEKCGKCELWPPVKCNSFVANPDLKPGPLTIEDRGWTPK